MELFTYEPLASLEEVTGRTHPAKKAVLPGYAVVTQNTTARLVRQQDGAAVGFLVDAGGDDIVRLDLHHRDCCSRTVERVRVRTKLFSAFVYVPRAAPVPAALPPRTVDAASILLASSGRRH